MFVLCLFDRKSTQSVVCLSAASGRDHPCILDLIDPAGAKIASPLARNIPEQIRSEIPRITARVQTVRRQDVARLLLSGLRATKIFVIARQGR
jgi:hypothetical protein